MKILRYLNREVLTHMFAVSFILLIIIVVFLLNQGCPYSRENIFETRHGRGESWAKSY